MRLTMAPATSTPAPIDVTSEAAMAASMAPSMPMPTPPKTDSVFQGPRPSTTGGTQVDIAGNIYAVLGDGSVIDQTGRTPPPPVAELARQKAGTPAAQFTTQQQYQDAQNLANRIGANSGENAVLPSENLLMGGGREGTPYLSTPAADTAIYAGGYDPQSRAVTSATGLATLSPETMPTVGGTDTPRYDTPIGPEDQLLNSRAEYIPGKGATLAYNLEPRSAEEQAAREEAARIVAEQAVATNKANGLEIGSPFGAPVKLLGPEKAGSLVDLTGRGNSTRVPRYSIRISRG
jgi:hypothetical protein